MAPYQVSYKCLLSEWMSWINFWLKKFLFPNLLKNIIALFPTKYQRKQMMLMLMETTEDN